MPPPLIFPPENDLSIALRKGTHSTQNPSPRCVTLSYRWLSSSITLVSSISSMSISKTIGDALAHFGWKQVMLDELYSL